MASRVLLVSCVALGGLTLLGGCNLFNHEADDDAVGDAHDAPVISCDGFCGNDPPQDPPIGGACNPLSPPGQQGCLAGQKCAWVQIQEEPTEIGKTTCVPDGTVPLGGACARGPAGELTGFDNCTAGNTCITGTCRDICGFDNSASAACATGTVCTRYSGLFGNENDDPIAGACADSCDPLTQLQTNGAPCVAGQACYLLTSQTTTIAVCAAPGIPTHGQPITGQAFANSCAPAHAPRRPTQGATTWECGALCRPAAVTSTTNMTHEGGTPPFTCESKGAAPPDSATAGESCRFYWAREPFDMLSPFSNTVGFCWKHAIWQYDSNGDQTPDAPFPRCTTLTTGDVVPPIGNPPHNDAEFFWCTPLASSLLGSPAREQRMPRDRAHPDQLGGWR